MKTENLTLVNQNLKFLDPEELENPIKGIDRFFQDDWLPGHLARLKDWRDWVLKDDYFKGRKGSPSELLYYHQLNVVLIESNYLLNSLPDKLGCVPNDESLAHEELQWRFYPDNLTKDELINPYKVIDKFFRDFTIDEYLDFLYEWLEFALTASSGNQWIEASAFILTFENLQKLYAASWVILQRTSNDPYLKIDNTIIDESDKSSISMINSEEAVIYDLNYFIDSEISSTLTNIVSIIKENVSTAQAIIYLGSSPSKKIFVLVLTSDKEPETALSISAKIEEICQKFASVVALVHYSKKFRDLYEHKIFLKKALSRPSVYLSGDFLFSSGLQLDGVQNGRINAEMWHRWFTQGKDFLSGANFYFKEGAANSALFSLHQCFEALLIALIRSVLGYHLNNHNLSRLLNITQIFTSDLLVIFDSENVDEMELFQILKKGYINVRYEDTFVAELDCIEKLLTKTNKFIPIVERLHNKHLELNPLK